MKIDFHVHSIESYDGTATLCEIAESAKKKGIDGVFITDHNRITLDKPVNMDGVWLLPGVEVSCRNAHIQGLLFNERFDIPEYEKGNLPEASEIIEKIHKAGGIAVIAHPFAHPTAKDFDPRNLTIQPDGCEIFNARGWMRNKECNKQAKDYAEELNLFVTGGSDGHLREEVGNAYAQLPCSDPSEIREMLLSRRSTAYLAENSKRIKKGWSQLEKANRTGRTSKKLKGIAYLIKCGVMDILGK